MRELSILKPAETLLLLDGSNAEFKSLMKFTLMDLVLKQVLAIDDSTITYKSGRKYKEQEVKYILKGKNFDAYVPSPFEAIYLSTFDKSADIQVVFSKLVKAAYELSGKQRKYRNLILSSHPYPNAFKRSFLQQIFSGFSLTSYGAELGAKLKKDLNDIDTKFSELLKNDPESALEQLKKIGGNIFLLKNVDFELLRKIDESIIESMKVNDSHNSDSYSYDWWLFFSFSDGHYSDFDSSSSSWDSSFDSFDSDFDSAGCSSSHSGCSSCSGCSGCGGCGGCGS